MVIIEFIKIIVVLICRLFVWLFTARDCEHCEHGRDIGFAMSCDKDNETANECLESIHRKHFKRGRWFV